MDISSRVGGATLVNARELVGRLFSTNTLIPSKTALDFTSLSDVADYFDTASDEYKRALFYFSQISKNNTSANKISFARWVDANQAPMIFGARLTASLVTLQGITAGSFTLTMGATTQELTAINLSTATTLADVATALQTKIRAVSGGGAQWTSATVTYNSTRGSFNLVGGDATTPAVISVAAGVTGTNIAALIGWYPQSITGAIWSNGILLQSVTDVLTDSANDNNNFGSFLFIDSLSDAEVLEAATWNDAQNNQFLFVTPIVDKTDAANKNAALIDLSGTSMTYAPDATEYDEMGPMVILAATDYTRRNSVQNYMFQQFSGLTPKVTTDADADFFDALRINYYGATQTAGQQLAFYQTGVLTGDITTDAISTNVYANELWLKDAALSTLMNFLLAVSKVSANAQGRAQILTILQSVIEQALLNGTISVNGFLSSSQINFITQITLDELAWHQVQNLGYWIDCEITAQTPTQFVARYTLVYKKDDVVRKVVGDDVLI